MFEINIHTIYYKVMGRKPTAEKSVKAKMKAEELAMSLGVGFKSIAAARVKPGFPKPSGGLFDVAAVCEWILATASAKRSKMWTGANLLLGKMKRPLLHPASPVVIALPEPAAILPADDSKPSSVTNAGDSDRDGDFGSILAKFRDTVDYCAMQCKQAAEAKEDDVLRGWLRTCGQAVEQLRKAEQSVLEIRTQRKSLLPRDDVIFAYASLGSNIRAKLMQLPMKLSHELVNVASAGQVQRIIDEELRIVLESLAGNPFGDE